MAKLRKEYENQSGTLTLKGTMPVFDANNDINLINNLVIPGDIVKEDGADTYTQSIQNRDGTIGLSEDSVFAISNASSAAGSSASPYLSVKWYVDDVAGITEPYDGMKIMVKIPLAGVGTAGVVLSINGDSNADYHPDVYNVSTVLTSQFSVNSYKLFVYDASASVACYITSGTKSTITGVWKADSNYVDGNTTTTYGTLAYYYKPYAAADIHQYNFVMEDVDNRVVPLVSDIIVGKYGSTTTYSVGQKVYYTSGGVTRVYECIQAGKGKTPSSQTAYWKTIDLTPTSTPFKPEKIYWYNTTATVAAGSAVGNNTLLLVGYSATNMAAFNFESGAPTYHLIYLCGTYNRTTGLFTLRDGGTPTKNYYTMVPDNTANLNLSDYFDDGYDYIFLGATYSSIDYVHLRDNNPMYHFDGTNLLPYDTWNENRIEASAGGTPTWGSIVGTLSDQTDLMSKFGEYATSSALSSAVSSINSTISSLNYASVGALSSGTAIPSTYSDVGALSAGTAIPSTYGDVGAASAAHTHSTYVPYSGATSDVNIGNHTLYATGVNIASKGTFYNMSGNFGLDASSASIVLQTNKDIYLNASSKAYYNNNEIATLNDLSNFVYASSSSTVISATYMRVCNTDPSGPMGITIDQSYGTVGIYNHQTYGMPSENTGNIYIDGTNISITTYEGGKLYYNNEEVATQTWVTSQGYLSSIPSTYATQSWVSSNFLSSATVIPSTYGDVGAASAGHNHDGRYLSTSANIISALGYTPLSSYTEPVNADWSATTGLSSIKNKPTLGTIASMASTDFRASTWTPTYSDVGALSSATVIPSTYGDVGAASAGHNHDGRYYSTSADVTTGLGFTPISAAALDGYATQSWVLSKNYISGISSNDVTTALGYTPLSSYTEPVNADWSATTGLSSIKNKPTLGTAASMASTDFRGSSWMPTYSDVGALSDDTFIPSTAADVNALPNNTNYTSKIILGTGGSEYAPSSGIITLPAYPTIPASLPANGGNASSLGGQASTYYASSGHNHNGTYLSNSTDISTALGFTPVSGTDLADFIPLTGTAVLQGSIQPVTQTNSIDLGISGYPFRSIYAVKFYSGTNGTEIVIPTSLPANGGNASSLAGQSGAYYASAGALAAYIPLTGTTSLSGGIFPQTTNTYDLGSTNNKFRSVYAREVFATFSVSASSVYTGDLYIGDSQIHKMYLHTIKFVIRTTSSSTGNNVRYLRGTTQLITSNSTTLTSATFTQALYGLYNASTKILPAQGAWSAASYCNVIGLYATGNTSLYFLAAYSTSASTNAILNSAIYSLNGTSTFNDFVVPLF